MTAKEHHKLKLWFIKAAKLAVRRRHWWEAADLFRAAAHHEAVLKAISR